VEIKLSKPTLIVICGWPFSGKTETATKLKGILGVHHIDIDEVRWLMIGQPYPYPNESPELMKRDVQEMAMAYRLLLAGASENLAAGRSLIITATFSRKIGQKMLAEIIEKYPQAELKVIQCVPVGDTYEEVARRLANRNFGEGGYKGAVNSPERYFEVKNRYEPIYLPHVKIETWGSENTPEDCAKLALIQIW